MDAVDLDAYPVHLGLGGGALPQPAFTGSADWYAAYARRTEGDGAEGRLVSMHAFSAPWTSWEMHPLGSELVVCTAGTITLHQERPDGTHAVVLGAGQYAINPPGIWHTADVDAPATALFITTGRDTQIRAR